jgi:proteasome lid subunit RPN8/RPN11
VRLCAHRRLGLASIGAEATVEFRPVWHAQLGEPYLSGLDAVLSLPGLVEASCRVPTAYFKKFASAASAPLVSEGRLESGEPFEYLVAAFPDPSINGAVEPPARFAIEEVPVPLALKQLALADFLPRSVECGEIDPEDIPVFIPQSVLDEADVLTRQTPAIEVASVLIGHLHRDRASNDLFLEVTAQIPARNAQSTAVKVAFGPETYQTVQDAITLRGRAEQWVGWFHSHPAAAWCNPQCSPEARAQCPLQRVFFSADDCDVHRTLFSKAFSIALLVTNTDAGLLHALFSWRTGLIVQRGFHILDGRQETHLATTAIQAATIGDKENEKTCSP